MSILVPPIRRPKRTAGDCFQLSADFVDFLQVIDLELDCIDDVWLVQRLLRVLERGDDPALVVDVEARVHDPGDTETLLSGNRPPGRHLPLGVYDSHEATHPHAHVLGQVFPKNDAGELIRLLKVLD